MQSCYCIKCHSNFLSKSTNRKYCYECSPFRNKNKTQVEVDSDTVCTICNRRYKYTESKGHTKKKCNSCMANKYKSEKKQKLLDIKGNKCLLCGYCKCNKALSFHHLNETEKSFNISGSHGRKLETLEKEIDKCILVCQNCHAEIHAGLHPHYLYSGDTQGSTP